MLSVPSAFRTRFCARSDSVSSSPTAALEVPLGSRNAVT